MRRHPVCGFFERDLEVVTEIGAALRRCASRATAPATKHISKTKQIAEDVFNSTKTGSAPRARACGATGNSGMTEPVVTLPLLGIREDAVGFGSFFKLLFRGCVVRILVRMIFDRETPVSALYFLVRSGAANG